MRRKLSNGRKIPKEMILKADTSLDHMKKVRKMFKGIEHVKISMSGCQLLEKARTARRI